MSYNNQLLVVEQYFTNIAAMQNVGLLQQIWLYQIIWGMLLKCKNTTKRVYGAWIKTYYVFSCDQAALWMVQSVRPSVCLSVRPSVCLSVTPFWLCSHHRIIMKFSGVITSDRSDVHAKGQGQRSKVKVTEVTTQFYLFRTVTPV